MGIQYTCIVCGKKFPEGQGIIIRRDGLELFFHSKGCLGKFMQRVITEASNISCIINDIENLVKEYEKLTSKEKEI